MLTLMKKPTIPVEMLRYEDMVGYLRATGWERRISNNQKWHIFFHDLPGTSQQIEIALPIDKDVPDIHIQLMGAINTLAAIQNKPIETVIQTVVATNRSNHTMPAKDKFHESADNNTRKSTTHRI